MSRAQTAALRHLDGIDAALGRQARALFRLSRSIKLVYALADSYRPGLGAEVRDTYAAAQRACYARDKARMDAQIVAVRAAWPRRRG